ncbi:MAG: hypothetical protein INR71_00110 [Terriglobus roseus]|nr:hypothetical protein [Terriglobus roseus]
MDSSTGATTDEQSQYSKQRFWSRVRRSREKRSNRFSRDSSRAGRSLGLDLCTRRTTRNIIRFSYLAAACAFTSIITL